MTFVLSGRKLFVPAQHLWLRATKQTASSSVTTRYPWLVDIGISHRGIEDIGDVSAMNVAAQRMEPDSTKQERFVNDGDDLIYIDWDAHMITAADELYHTVWQTITDTSVIRAPVSGRVEHINCISPDEEELDDDLVLVKLHTDYDALKRGMNEGGWMEEEEYDELVNSSSRGMFESA